MDAPELRRRLESMRGDAQAIAALVAEAARDEDGEVDPLALGDVARVVHLEWEDGHTRDAVELCVDALNLVGEHARQDDDDDSDGAFLRSETLRWMRWELRHALRVCTRRPQQELLAICERLAPSERSWLARPGLATGDVVRAADDADALADLLVEATTALDEEDQLDALVAIREACTFLAQDKRHAAAVRLSREAIEQLVEGNDMPSDPARAALQTEAAALVAVLCECLSCGGDSPWVSDTIAWLVEPVADKEPRLTALFVPVESLTQDVRRALVRSLEKRAEKSERYARALARAAKGVLADDAYLDLCRRVRHHHEVVTVLLARGDAEQALAEARAAVAEQEWNWTLAKELVAHGHADLAEQLLAEVARDTVNSEIEFYLADLLRKRGGHEEALAVHRRRFDKRPALPQYCALRDLTPESQWPALRNELLEGLRARRLARTLIDIAAEERDWVLAQEVFPSLREDEAAYADQRLAPFLADARGKQVAALRLELERSRAERQRRAPPSLPPVSSVSVPRRVRHKKFGLGTVAGHSGAGADLKLEVDFEGEAGRKVLLARFVEPLDDGA